MLLGLLLLILSPSPAIAVDEFNLTQEIQFQIDQKGNSRTIENTTITNNFSQIYLKEYKINLSQIGLKNIRAVDSIGNIISKIDTSKDNTSIFLKFNQPSVGKNQQTKFTLSYDITDFAKKKGKTWEIVLPKFTKTSTNQDIKITINIPTAFGDLSSSSVALSNYHNLGDFHRYQILDFNNNEPIVLVFGNYQLFDFQFDYYLNNPDTVTVNTQIALPPDTNSQTVRYTQIAPLPLKVDIDPDGNWLATYQIAPKTDLFITATGQVKIMPPKSTPVEINLADFTKSQEFWPVDSPQVKSLSANLSTPQSVYNLVVDYLQYDYTRLNSAKRLGALFAINNPQNSLCTEFADLFVTLARSRGIAAREIQGFAYSTDDKVKPTNLTSDILHAWAQYYDPAKKIWISVDPTWQKTTNGIDYFNDLDLNHFTFVLHGLDSSYPSPPGAYKNNRAVKTVTVDFAQNENDVVYSPPQIKISGKTITISNPNLASLNQINISDGKWSTQIKSLPPLGQSSFDYPLNLFKFKINFERNSLETGSTPKTVTNPLREIILISLMAVTIILLSILGIILTRHRHEKNS